MATTLASCGYGSVVGTGNPAGIFSLHTGAADQNILDGIVQAVPHVQDTGNIWRRYNNGIGVALLIGTLLKYCLSSQCWYHDWSTPRFEILKLNSMIASLLRLAKVQNGLNEPGFHHA